MHPERKTQWTSLMMCVKWNKNVFFYFLGYQKADLTNFPTLNDCHRPREKNLALKINYFSIKICNSKMVIKCIKSNKFYSIFCRLLFPNPGAQLKMNKMYCYIITCEFIQAHLVQCTYTLSCRALGGEIINLITLAATYTRPFALWSAIFSEEAAPPTERDKNRLHYDDDRAVSSFLISALVAAGNLVNSRMHSMRRFAYMYVCKIEPEPRAKSENDIQYVYAGHSRRLQKFIKHSKMCALKLEAN